MPTNEDPLPADVRAHLEWHAREYPVSSAGLASAGILAKFSMPGMWLDGDIVNVTIRSRSTRGFVDYQAVRSGRAWHIILSDEDVADIGFHP